MSVSVAPMTLMAQSIEEIKNRTMQATSFLIIIGIEALFKIPSQPAISRLNDCCQATLTVLLERYPLMEHVCTLSVSLHGSAT